jgi:hypothetical protein
VIFPASGISNCLVSMEYAIASPENGMLEAVATFTVGLYNIGILSRTENTIVIIFKNHLISTESMRSTWKF